MKDNSTALLLRIFVSTTDKADHEALYEHIVFKAKQFGMLGATVLKGVLGFGSSSVIHSTKFWELTEKLPVIIEIIDEEEKIMSFYESIRPALDNMRYGCLVTTQKVQVLKNKPGRKHVQGSGA